MAYSTRDVVTSMAAHSGHAVPRLRADGGASANGWLLQFQADQLQVPVVRPVVQETTALGAACLAGLAEGVWSNLDDLAGAWRSDVELAPSVSAGAADALHAGWSRAVERSLGWAR
jgi:glycerol kinase